MSFLDSIKYIKYKINSSANKIATETSKIINNAKNQVENLYKNQDKISNINKEQELNNNVESLLFDNKVIMSFAWYTFSPKAKNNMPILNKYERELLNVPNNSINQMIFQDNTKLVDKKIDNSLDNINNVKNINNINLYIPKSNNSSIINKAKEEISKLSVGSSIETNKDLQDIENLNDKDQMSFNLYAKKFEEKNNPTINKYSNSSTILNKNLIDEELFFSTNDVLQFDKYCTTTKNDSFPEISKWANGIEDNNDSLIKDAGEINLTEKNSFLKDMIADELNEPDLIHVNIKSNNKKATNITTNTIAKAQKIGQEIKKNNKKTKDSASGNNLLNKKNSVKSRNSKSLV